MNNTHLKIRIRNSFLTNPELSLKDLSIEFGCSYTYVCQCLEQHNDYSIVVSLNSENEYFLFTDLVEKTVKTNCTKHVQNEYDFNNKEKTFLKGYGFKF